MNGPPEDKEGECNARLFLSDDYGDNRCTFRCQLSPEHEGQHREMFGRGVTTWGKDDRYHCTEHGVQTVAYCPDCVVEKLDGEEESEP